MPEFNYEIAVYRLARGIAYSGLVNGQQAISQSSPTLDNGFMTGLYGALDAARQPGCGLAEKLCNKVPDHLTGKGARPLSNRQYQEILDALKGF